MENLNAEEIKRLLAEYEVVCDNCACNDGDEIGKKIMLNALSLINSQEQRIKELAEENERLITAIPLWAKQCVELEERCMALGAEVSVKKKLLDKAEETIAKERADTVKEMHSMLCEGRVSNDNVVIVANQVAKEMLEEE